MNGPPERFAGLPHPRKGDIYEMASGVRVRITRVMRDAVSDHRSAKTVDATVVGGTLKYTNVPRGVWWGWKRIQPEGGAA